MNDEPSLFEPSSEPGAIDPLAGLNAAQREAVVHDSGPLAVLAGPGTGKTRVIIHRIAHLMQSRGAAPEQVVGVTFTVKAAEEMRERLARLVDPSLAQRVHIHTFHGLGLRLLKRFGDMMGLPPEPELVDSSQRRTLLRELISQHGLFPESVGLGRDTVLALVDRYLEAFWNHAIDDAAVARCVASWEARIAGEADPRRAQAEQALLARFRDAARAVALFDAACRERGWVSYGDLLTLPARLMRERPAVAQIVGSEWRHLVVDEFQDVNAAQIALLELLAPPGDGGAGPDLCVVGDDDQSIYRFRGSDDRAFDRFALAWRGPRVIELAENYRSQACVIGVANDVISRAGGRFRRDKAVRRADALAADPVLPGAEAVAIALAEERHDGDVIAAMILADRAARPGAAWRDYAVLARAGGDLDRVGAALALEGIPVARRRAPGGAAADQGVLDVFAWIEALTDPDASWAVRRILVRPPWGLPPDRVAQWERRFAKIRSHHAAGDETHASPGPFLEWLMAHAGNDPEHGEQLAALKRLHDQLAADAGTLPADAAVFRIMTLADAAHADLLSGRDRATRVSNLLALLRFARTRQERLAPPADLAALWRYYQDLSAKEQRLDADQHARIDVAEAGEPDAVPDADEPGDPGLDGVQLVTAHSAKGLEFDTVFVTRVCPPHGFPNTRDDDDILPEGLIQRPGDARSPKDRHLDEERRLFYVACTRAMRRLVLLARRTKGPSKSTNFFEELVRHEPRPIPLRDWSDVLADAAVAGVGAATRGDLAAEGGALDRLDDLRDALAGVRRDARLGAAAALDALDRPSATPADLDRSAAGLREAGGLLAIAAAIERDRVPPPWADDPAHPGWKAAASRLLQIAARGGTMPSRLVFPPLPPPLRLSFTLVRDYEACPRCCYLKHVLGLPDASAPRAAVGRAAHEALKTFYRQWARTDSEGAPRPGRNDLLRLGRRAFFQELSRHELADRDGLEQLLAQLGQSYDALHDDAAHVVELEQSFPFPYDRAGHTHTITAKLDRVDQGPGGEVILIDYKTGAPSKKLLEPEPDDLQLSIYALALQHRAPGVPLRGRAEYWVLATGQRGCIDLVRLNLDKARRRLDKVIDALLAGDFPAAGSDRRCSGACKLFGG